MTVIPTGLAPARRMQMPISVVHSQLMQRTGTHDHLPTLNHSVTQPMHVSAQPGMPTAAPLGNDYANVNVPSVWRTGRTQVAAKVDALSSNGMDEIDIPAFLRRQAN